MFYALQVATGKEEQFIKRVERSELAEQYDITLYFPQRMMLIRRQGKKRKELFPLFRGYVFLEIDTLTVAFRLALKKISGMFRFLPSNAHPQALYGKDVDLLKSVLSFGAYADISTVRFNENDRIEVISGSLKTLEGYIIHVDRRKGRATVSLEMNCMSVTSTLSFEEIQETTIKKE